MIRSGKSSSTSWLHIASDRFGPWASLSGISLNEIHVGTPSEDSKESSSGVKNESQNFSDIKGAGVIASADLGPGPCQPLMSVPESLVLSKQRVHEIAAGDAKLLELLSICGDFALVS